MTATHIWFRPWCILLANLPIHYDNMPIQIYWKFYNQKKKKKKKKKMKILK